MRNAKRTTIRKDPNKLPLGKQVRYWKRAMSKWMLKYYALEKEHEALLHEINGTTPAPKRPNKEAALKWLALDGEPVKARFPVVSLTDSDNGVHQGFEEVEAVLATSPELLGWTWDELNDPAITE